MQEQKLYLVFEFLKMDLKKYFETFRSGATMDMALVKVCKAFVLQVLSFFTLFSSQYHFSEFKINAFFS